MPLPACGPGDGRDHGRARREAAGCEPAEVFLASTGVIGEPIPPGKFEGVLERLAGEAVEDGFAEAARTIMTTDTFPKLASRVAEIGGVPVTLNGIAKGSGMIAPDMATMLGLHLHRRRRSPRPRCRRCSAAMSRPASTPLPSIATPRPAIRCWPSPPARRAAARGSSMPTTRRSAASPRRCAT